MSFCFSREGKRTFTKPWLSKSFHPNRSSSIHNCLWPGEVFISMYSTIYRSSVLCLSNSSQNVACRTNNSLDKEDQVLVREFKQLVRVHTYERLHGTVIRYCVLGVKPPSFLRLSAIVTGRQKGTFPSSVNLLGTEPNLPWKSLPFSDSKLLLQNLY